MLWQEHVDSTLWAQCEFLVIRNYYPWQETSVDFFLLLKTVVKGVKKKKEECLMFELMYRLVNTGEFCLPVMSKQWKHLHFPSVWLWGYSWKINKYGSSKSTAVSQIMDAFRIALLFVVYVQGRLFVWFIWRYGLSSVGRLSRIACLVSMNAKVVLSTERCQNLAIYKIGLPVYLCE